MRVYLAGAVRDAEDFGKTWRENFEVAWGDTFDVLNPLDIYDSEALSFEHGNYSLESSGSVVPGDEVVQTDEQMVEDSDFVYAHWEEGLDRCGTPMEIKHASENGVPVVVEYVGEDKRDASIWLHSKATYVGESNTECVQWALDHLGGDEGE